MPKALNADILQNLSVQYGGSFYLLDSDAFEANYLELLEAFRTHYPKSNIAYSYKTNYTPKLVRIVDRLGGYAEVVSDMEMEIALRSGVRPSSIIWNGPIKNPEKAKELLLAGGTINLDSLNELGILRGVLDSNPDRLLHVGLRCNYNVCDGVLSRFGFDTQGDDFRKALDYIAKNKKLCLTGLQVHFAKRDPQYWPMRTEGLLKTCDDVVSRIGIFPKRLDLGGGIYGKMPNALREQLGIGNITYEDYAVGSAKLFAEHFLNAADAPELLIEPGTAIAGDCMRFICKVETIKTVRGKAIATVMGSQKNISMNGINPPMTVIHCGNELQVYTDMDIVGYTCIEGDVLQKNYCGPLSVGDYLVFGNCGSYSLVMKPPFIFPNVPVLDISANQVEVIKRRECFDDLFRTFSF